MVLPVPHLLPLLQALLAILDLLHCETEPPPRLLSLVKPGEVVSVESERKKSQNEASTAEGSSLSGLYGWVVVERTAESTTGFN